MVRRMKNLTGAGLEQLEQNGGNQPFRGSSRALSKAPAMTGADWSTRTARGAKKSAQFQHDTPCSSRMPHWSNTGADWSSKRPVLPAPVTHPLKGWVNWRWSGARPRPVAEPEQAA